jgi:hypothetical protein
MISAASGFATAAVSAVGDASLSATAVGSGSPIWISGRKKKPPTAPMMSMSSPISGVAQDCTTIVKAGDFRFEALGLCSGSGSSGSISLVSSASSINVIPLVET